MHRHVLLGEISSYKAIVIAKYLRKNYPNLTIIGYDHKKSSKYLHTKYCDDFFLVKNPNKSTCDHIGSISEIIREQKIDLFIPVDSKMYGTYLNHKRYFGNAFSYIGNYEVYEKLHNKDRSQQLAKELSIRIPETFDNIIEARIPFVAKPTNQSSSLGVQYVFSEKQKRKLKLDPTKKYVFQEYIDGTGCGYSVFAKKGQPIIGYGHIRLAELPISGGSSVYRDAFENPAMESIAKKILENTVWSGFAMFEFKLTPENEIVLIEINPRIWGSINQGLQNHINYFESILGKTESLYVKQIKTFLSPSIYISLFKYILKLQMKPLITFLRNIHYNRVDVSLFSDPKGYVSMILRRL